MESRRMSFLWGILPLAVALVWLAREFEVFPAGLSDLLMRAAPVVLVIVGLALLLRDRVRFPGLASIIISGVLVAGIAVFAFSSRSDQQRDEQQVEIDQEIASSVTLLAVNITTQSTDVQILHTDDAEGRISGLFTGSTESSVSLDYVEREDGTAEFTLNEASQGDFPLLEAVGRGTLRLELPSEVGIAVAFRGDDGNATLNMSDVWLERMSVEVTTGNLLVTLPEYEPRSPNADEQPGQLIVRDGDVTIFVSENVAARLELNRGGNNIRPQFFDSYILIDDGADGTLEKRSVGENDIPLYYEVTAPRGVIRLELSGAE